jgi:polysaccharide export outer membrane protein
MSPRIYLAAILVVCSLVTVPADAAPIVHPGDTLSISVLNFDSVIDDSRELGDPEGRFRELNAGSVVVAADGSVSIPVIGTVTVAGKNVQQIGRVIATRMSPYVRDPSVIVRLLQQSQLIFLTGATTGTLPFLPGETLASALGQLREQYEKVFSLVLNAGDKNGGVLGRSAIDLRNVVLERDTKLRPPIDGEELLRSGLPGPSLEPGDTILFANKPVRVNVTGQVLAPGPIFLYKNDTLERAVLEAGGPLASASTVDASLIREGREIPIPLAGAAIRQVPEDGDTIIVRAAPHITVLGQVPTPGEFVLKNGSTLLSALYVAGGPTKWANVKDIEVLHAGDRTSYNLSGLQHGDLSPNVPLFDGDIVYVPEGHRIDASLFFQGLIGALAGAYDVSHF